MALNSINTNVAAYYAQQNISKANNMASSSIGRLSSGNRIVKASDDVAAMAVGTSLRSTVSALKVGLNNASQGTSMLQVADGALGKIQDILLRQKALATQATSGSITAANRGFLNQEFQNLTQEIDRVVENTNFNGVNLLSGTLGNAAQLATADTVSAALAAGGGVIASTVAIQAFNTGATPATAHGVTAGLMQLVDGSNTALANSSFTNVNQAVYGKVGEFKLSNLQIGASADISVEINGITFSGTVGSDAAATAFTLSNGNTRIRFGATATNLNFGSALTAQTGINALNTSFRDVSVFQTSTVNGVNFTGTALQGVTSNAASSAPMLRLSDMSDTSIKNFSYVSNGGAANTSTLSVDVGGKTFYATSVVDNIVAGTVLTFTDGKQQALQVNLTGLTTAITNIRTSATDRDNFINALNTSFANIGGGVDFALGVESSDKLTVAISKSDTASLFGNQALDISTQVGAQAAGTALNQAIDSVTAIRANVGALMSRFDYASANLEIAVQNQDAARGTLLDTDVSAESTAYATYQVQLQAGIAVLAQANQLPQNMLKLLG
jgi:flagellin